MKALVSMAVLTTTCLPSTAVAQDTLIDVSAAVSLSAGIKNLLRQPNVDFEVVQPDGTRSKATAIARDGEMPGTVNYPSDFSNAGRHEGTYRWTARAAGKVIASGTFKFLPARGGSQVFVPD